MLSFFDCYSDTCKIHISIPIGCEVFPADPKNLLSHKNRAPHVVILLGSAFKNFDGQVSMWPLKPYCHGQKWQI